MENNEKIYQNLIIILKLFKNRPYHLAKYLIDNNAFTDEFKVKLEKSDKLGELSKDELKSSVKTLYFVDISQMTDYFNSLTDEKADSKKSKDVITKELNEKLDQCLKEEKYEDAIRIRDYMTKNNIPRNNF
jgi:hypothetical protein